MQVIAISQHHLFLLLLRLGNRTKTTILVVSSPRLLVVAPVMTIDSPSAMRTETKPLGEVLGADGPGLGGHARHSPGTRNVHQHEHHRAPE